MALYKQYLIVNADNGDEVEGFSTMESAEQFLAMMRAKGNNFILKTRDEDIVEDETTYEIEGLEQITPENEFGDELNNMYSDDDELDFDD